MGLWRFHSKSIWIIKNLVILSNLKTGKNKTLGYKHSKVDMIGRNNLKENLHVYLLARILVMQLLAPQGLVMGGGYMLAKHFEGKHQHW